MTCNAEGDELTSDVKILFFKSISLASTLSPFQVRCKSVSSPFLRMGGKGDLHRTHVNVALIFCVFCGGGYPKGHYDLFYM